MGEVVFPAGDLMKGKRGLIMGVANKNSIAWGIAQQLRAQGAELCFSYIPAMESRVRQLAESIGVDFLVEADVMSDDDMDRAFAEVKSKWGEIDFLVHSIAFTGQGGPQRFFC